MELIQYLIILFVLFTTSRVILQFKNNKMTLPQFVFWQTLWIIVFIFGIFPSQFAFLSTLLGIDRIVDLFLYVSIGLLFYMIYRLYAKMNALQQEMTKLTRAIAVGHAKNPKKSKQ